MQHAAKSKPLNTGRSYAIPMLAAVLLVLGGIWGAKEAGYRTDARMRRELINTAESVAATIRPAEVNELAFDRTDLSNPTFLRISARLQAIAEVKGLRSLYTMALRDSQIVFGPESLLPDDPYAAPPGTLFGQPRPSDFAVFKDAKAIATGPVSDEYGTFVSAVAPVRSLRTGEVLLAVGIDVDVSDWQARIREAMLLPLWLTQPPLLLLICGWLVTRLRHRLAPARQLRLRHTEPATCLLVLVVMSLCAAALTHRWDAQARAEAFLALADLNSVTYAEELRAIDNDINMISALFEASDYISPAEFSSFSRQILNRNTVAGIGWVQKVTPSERAEFEQATGHLIWNPNPAGGRTPAPTNTVLYPLRFAEPADQSGTLIGKNALIGPRRRSALLEALRTGETAASIPVEQNDSPGKPGPILIFHPSSSRTQEGLTEIAIHLDDLLRRLSHKSAHGPIYLATSLMELDGQASPIFLGSTNEQLLEATDADQAKMLKQTIPLLAFGKVYLLTISPTQAWLDSNPLRNGPSVLLAGLVLTITLTWLVAILTNRPVMLERMVQQRTADLQRAEQHIRTIYDASNDAFFIHDATTGAILDANRRATMLYGRSKQELIKSNIAELSEGAAAYTQRLAKQYMERALNGEPQIFEWRARHSNGNAFWVEVNMSADIIDGERRLIASVRDIDERKAVEAQLELTQFAVDNLADAAYWCDAQGRITYVNNASSEALGYTADELLGMNVSDVDIELLPEVWVATLANLKQDKIVVLERTHRRKDGSLFPVEVKIHYIEFGETRVICAFAHDITTRRENENQIEESRRFLRTVLDTIPIRVFWKDRSSIYMGGNLTFAQDAGLAATDELAGKSDFDLSWDVEQAEAFRKDDHEVITSGKAKLNIEEHIVRDDGGPHWLRTNKIPLRDTDDNVIGVLGTYEDITERKRMQDAIKRRVVALTRPLDDTGEITFDELFDLTEVQRIQDEFSRATGVASLITDPQGNPLTKPSNFTDFCAIHIRGTERGLANCRQSDAVLGQAHAAGAKVQTCLSAGLWDAGTSISVGGRHVASWLIGQVRDETQSEAKLRQYLREIGADEKAAMEAYRRVPAMSREHFDSIAQVLCTLSTQLSTTAYQNMQQARFIADERRRTEELRRLTAAIKQTPDSIVITSCEGKVVYANPAFQTSSGYTVAEMMGRPLSDLKSGQHDAGFYADLWSTISSGRTWTGRLINRRKNGELYTEEAVVSPVRDDDGAIVNYVGIKRDITKELQQEAQNQQSQKMQAVGQLAGGIAHDFNNILQAILGFSELLMPTVEEHERAHVSEIRKAAKHAAELTKQLLAFSRKRPVESRIINLNSTIEETREILSSLIGENIKVTTELDPQLSPVQADSSQLARILINLAVNGRDAMPRGGTIAIRTRNVTISTQQALGYPHGREGTFACLSVADTGTGMPAEVKEHIFEPFFSTKGPGEGTGLGLASAYGIIQEHNGWIDVDSEEDNGSTFRIYLPVDVSQPAATPQMPSAPEPLAHGNNEIVLLVEDDPAIRLLVETALTSADFKVLVAGDTTAARQLFEEHAGRVDLLISDVVLPDETGPELADALRAQKPKLPVLLCSGYSRGHITQEEIKRKQYHFLEKPFTITQLLDVVHATLHDTPI